MFTMLNKHCTISKDVSLMVKIFTFIDDINKKPEIIAPLTNVIFCIILDKSKKKSNKVVKLKTNTKVILILRMLHYCLLHLFYTGQSPYWTVTSSTATLPCPLLALMKI